MIQELMAVAPWTSSVSVQEETFISKLTKQFFRIIFLLLLSATQHTQNKHTQHHIHNLSVCLCLPACLPACLPTCLTTCLPDCLSTCLPVHSSIHPSICLSLCLSVCLSVTLSVCLLSVSLFIHPSVCPSLHLSIHSSACSPICLIACSSIWTVFPKTYHLFKVILFEELSSIIIIFDLYQVPDSFPFLHCEAKYHII